MQAHEPFPGPPVRRRSAHGRCSSKRTQKPSLALSRSSRRKCNSESARHCKSRVIQAAGGAAIVCARARLQVQAAAGQVRAARGPAVYRSAEASGPCRRRRIRPRHVASERFGCQNAPRTCRRHLTLPSSGRSKGRFAPFGPPLMSNVRPHCVQSAWHRLGQLAFVRTFFEHQSKALFLAAQFKLGQGRVAKGRNSSAALPSSPAASLSPLSARAVRPSAARSPQFRRTHLEQVTSLRQSPSSCLRSWARFKHTERMQEQCIGSLRVALQSSATRSIGRASSNPGAASNPSIERTFQRPLRALWPAAHVKR